MNWNWIYRSTMICLVFEGKWVLLLFLEKELIRLKCEAYKLLFTIPNHVYFLVWEDIAFPIRSMFYFSLLSEIFQASMPLDTNTYDYASLTFETMYPYISILQFPSRIEFFLMLQILHPISGSLWIIIKGLRRLSFWFPIDVC